MHLSDAGDSVSESEPDWTSEVANSDPRNSRHPPTHVMLLKLADVHRLVKMDVLHDEKLLQKALLSAAFG